MLQKVAQDLPQMTTRQCVVTDEGEPPGREACGAKTPEGVAHRRWDPGVQAMSDDVVELAQLIFRIKNIENFETYVSQFQRCNNGASLFYRATSEVKPDHLRVWRGLRQIDDIAAVSTGHLKDARAVERRPRSAKEMCQCAKP